MQLLRNALSAPSTFRNLWIATTISAEPSSTYFLTKSSLSSRSSPLRNFKSTASRNLKLGVQSTNLKFCRSKTCPKTITSSDNHLLSSSSKMWVHRPELRASSIRTTRNRLFRTPFKTARYSISMVWKLWILSAINSNSINSSKTAHSFPKRTKVLLSTSLRSIRLRKSSLIS